MLSKRYESTVVDRRSWLHVTAETLWSTSSDTHQVFEICNPVLQKVLLHILSNILGLSTLQHIFPKGAHIPLTYKHYSFVFWVEFFKTADSGAQGKAYELIKNYHLELKNTVFVENKNEILNIITTIRHIISREGIHKRRNSCKVNYYCFGRNLKSI